MNLEENAKKILIAFHKGKISIFGSIKDAVDLTNGEIIDATKHLEENNYWEIVGGTPKSGPAYKITGEGLKYAGIKQ